jgi:DNA repair exonuclease SbcCD ATPase subunit
VNSSNESYETLKGRVKVVAGELKERRVECRVLQVHIEELTLSKTELQEQVWRLQAQGATLDHAKSATLLEVDSLKEKLELAEAALEESKSAIHKEKLKGEEVLATYKKKAQTALAVANARASSAIQSKEEAELEARAARSMADATLERARLAETKGNEAITQAKAFVESVEAQAPEIARLQGELASVIQERLELKSLVEKLQLKADKVTCEATTLVSQLESEKSHSLQFQSELADALNRTSALEEAVNKLGREKIRLMDELQSQERSTQGQQPSVTNGGPSTASFPPDAFLSKQSVAEQSHAESTIRMLQQELQDANAAIKELKETLRNSIVDSEQSAVDDQPGRDSTAAGQKGANSMPLFYAMEKQAELTQARNEISRLASLLGDAESTKQEALDAMDEMKRKMEEAESRLQRQQRLGGGNHNSLPAAKVGVDSKTTVTRGAAKTGDHNGESGNVNLEYLKNIVLSYLNAKSVAERKALLPVISTVLCFTADEQQRALHGTANGGGSQLLDAVTDSMLKFRW